MLATVDVSGRLAIALRGVVVVAGLWQAGGSAAQAATAVVPGTADPYLAGMPDGATNGSDSAPAHSPVLVTGIDLPLGGALVFTNAVGGTDRNGSCAVAPPYGGCDPIDGAEFWTHAGGAQNGISTVRAPISALMGVFLGAAQPSLSAAPAGLDFEALGVDFTALAPQLKQVFFIGDGKTAANVAQSFAIPAGATRLYLGTMDGFGWFNNGGAITVDVGPVDAVPEPATWALLMGGLVAVAGARRQRRTHPPRHPSA